MFTFNDWRTYYPKYYFETDMHRFFSMYMHYLTHFRTHRLVIEGIASKGPRDQLTIQYIRARIPKRANIISTSSDHSLALSYLVFQNALFGQKTSSEILFERIVLPVSGIEQVLAVLVDDGRIYADERHAPSILGDHYHRTRLQYLLDTLQYPKDAFNKIYRRGRKNGS